VAVKDGAVTLTGHTSTYGEKLAAARAAERVYGVKAVANDIKVKLSGDPRDDSDIAQAIAHVLENNTRIPEGKVRARVQAGWVTLDGEVEWDYQRREVERMVRNVRGVVGITNIIVVKPRVSPAEIEAKIEEAFRREAEVDARHVRVEVSDHTAQHYGAVGCGPWAAQSTVASSSSRSPTSGMPSAEVDSVALSSSMVKRATSGSSLLALSQLLPVHSRTAINSPVRAAAASTGLSAVRQAAMAC
jgi:osmotically-inducible protein OsmY